MASKGVKQLLFEQFARVGKAMSNANRLEILEFLAQSEYNVEELSKLAGITVANTSQHLQQLRQAGLVSSRKQGLKVYYSLSDTDVFELFAIQRKVAERHLAEVNQLIDHFLICQRFTGTPAPRRIIRAHQTWPGHHHRCTTRQ